MKLKTLLTAAVMGLIAAACSTSQKENAPQADLDVFVQPQPGDSTIYGLACEGSNDTILMVLRNLEQDPDTFDILNAMQFRRVMGRPSTGDLIALTVDTADSTQADRVIVLSELRGSWCYMVTPKLRLRPGITTEMHDKFMREMPDSMRKRLLQPREYGVELKQDFVARPIGVQRQTAASHNSPAEYPKLKLYREWHVFNGRIVLSVAHPDSLGVQQIVDNDTAEIVRLRRDTLVLRFTNGTEQTYYRK